jgi:protease-4
MEEKKITKKEKKQVNKVLNILKETYPSLIAMGVITAGVFLGCFLSSSILNRPSESYDSTQSGYDDTAQYEECSVLGINLHGSIITYVPEHAEGDSFFDYDVTSSDDVIWSIKTANEDPSIKAILVEVDSGGGSPVAGEEISNAIKASKKPVVAVIRDTGVSSAYWSISSADKIFASANSDIGSIGVTMSYLSNSEKNKKEGLLYEEISSGKYKDSGSPDKTLTNDEKKLFMRDVNIIYNNFVKAVSENRLLTIDKVKGFADGSSVLGEKAKELGMIDEIGGMPEALGYIERLVGEKAEVCW